MNIEHGPVETLNRKDIPSINETIADDIDIDECVKSIKIIRVYFRDKESCPYNRGNWIIDFFDKLDTSIPLFCLKLPAEMEEEDVIRWVKPLSDKIKNNNN